MLTGKTTLGKKIILGALSLAFITSTFAGISNYMYNKGHNDATAQTQLYSQMISPIEKINSDLGIEYNVDGNNPYEFQKIDQETHQNLVKMSEIVKDNNPELYKLINKLITSGHISNFEYNEMRMMANDSFQENVDVRDMTNVEYNELYEMQKNTNDESLKTYIGNVLDCSGEMTKAQFDKVKESYVNSENGIEFQNKYSPEMQVKSEAMYTSQSVEIEKIDNLKKYVNENVSDENKRMKIQSHLEKVFDNGVGEIKADSFTNGQFDKLKSNIEMMVNEGQLVNMETGEVNWNLGVGMGS